jgi:hypothetical protein
MKRIAVESAYAGVPAYGPPPKVDIQYVEKNALVINDQLQNGGRRLAMILNRAFAVFPTTNPMPQRTQ